MCINTTPILSCLTSAGVQENEIISSFGWYYFFIKTKTFMCLPFHQSLKLSRHVGVGLFVVVLVVELEFIVLPNVKSS